MVYIISHKKVYVLAGLLLAVVLLASLWLQYLYPNKGIAAAGMLAGVLLLGIVVVSLLDFMIKSKRVTRELIYAAILLYLLAALLWAFLYTFLELVDPASFNIDLSQ